MKIGSIGIMPYSSEIAVLEKFFVYERYQGKPYHIGRKLYDELFSFARKEAYKTILLDTPHNTEREHKFYERAGFQKVNETDLPFGNLSEFKDKETVMENKPCAIPIPRLLSSSLLLQPALALLLQVSRNSDRKCSLRL